MSMITSQMLKSVGFTKAQKSRYLEKNIFFFSNKKVNYTSRTTLKSAVTTYRWLALSRFCIFSVN